MDGNLRRAKSELAGVCTENSVRIDLATEVTMTVTVWLAHEHLQFFSCLWRFWARTATARSAGVQQTDARNQRPIKPPTASRHTDNARIRCWSRHS
jgi:hypothetical protein